MASSQPQLRRGLSASPAARTRRSAFGDQANHDDGASRPVAFALTEVTAADEARIGELVTRAVGPGPEDPGRAGTPARCVPGSAIAMIAQGQHERGGAHVSNGCCQPGPPRVEASTRPLACNQSPVRDVLPTLRASVTPTHFGRGSGSMKPTTVRRRGRALASLTATMGLCLGAASVVSAPAQSAEPAGDCAARVPVSVAKGDPVTGLTVTGVGSSTAPEGFTGEVLGNSRRRHRARPRHGHGAALVAGDRPGRRDLAGHVRFAGVRPGRRADRGGRLRPFVRSQPRRRGHPVRRHGVLPRVRSRDPGGRRRPGRPGDRAEQRRDRGPGRQGLRAAAACRPGCPGSVSADSSRPPSRPRAHRWMPTATYRMGAAAAPGDGAAGPETIVAGGNLAATVSYGDITQGGVGTATSVCNGKVVGFGHPMTFLGKTTLTLHPADALYIQDDPTLAPYKVANLGAPAGTITDDHLAGITGTFGALPATSVVRSTASYLRPLAHRDEPRLGALGLRPAPRSSSSWATRTGSSTRSGRAPRSSRGPSRATRRASGRSPCRSRIVTPPTSTSASSLPSTSRTSSSP